MTGVFRKLKNTRDLKKSLVLFYLDKQMFFYQLSGCEPYFLSNRTGFFPWKYLIIGLIHILLNI